MSMANIPRVNLYVYKIAQFVTKYLAITMIIICPLQGVHNGQKSLLRSFQIIAQLSTLILSMMHLGTHPEVGDSNWYVNSHGVIHDLYTS